jgi:hypothetical protein
MTAKRVKGGSAKSSFFDKETDESGTFFFANIGVASPLAPPGDIVAGARVGSVYLKNLAGSKFADFFFRSKKRHRATESFGIKYRGCFDIIWGFFEIAHGRSPELKEFIV